MNEHKTREQFAEELERLRQRLAEANHELAEARGQIAALQEAEAKYLQAEKAINKLEEQLHQQERLANIGQLTAGIAHDFSNFLTTMMFYAELIVDDPRLPSDLAPHAEAILSGSQRTAQLARQILDFSRRSMMKARPIDLASLLKEIVSILQRTLPENIQLVTEIKPGKHVANIDPARIEQVVVNLALNARDAMPEGGELRINLSRTETKPGEYPPGVKLPAPEAPAAEIPGRKWVCLTVADTGTGMTRETQTYLFEPFFTTKGEDGTGLGLAQVYSIVMQHEGHIGVETQVGQGTTFWIYLPAYDKEAAKRSTKGRSAAHRGRGETILLVEDEADMRQAAQDILESRGYRVLTAANGRGALEVYRAANEAGAEPSQRIDLVITDMVMPELGGKELILELRKVDPRARALALTGYVPPTAPEELQEMGIMGIIRKPVDVKVLVEAVRRALDAD